MSTSQLNRLILQKLDEKDLPIHVKEFIRDILLHEKGRLDQENPHYTTAYKTLLDKYMLRQANKKTSE